MLLFVDHQTPTETAARLRPHTRSAGRSKHREPSAPQNLTVRRNEGNSNLGRGAGQASISDNPDLFLMQDLTPSTASSSSSTSPPSSAITTDNFTPPSNQIPSPTVCPGAPKRQVKSYNRESCHHSTESDCVNRGGSSPVSPSELAHMRFRPTSFLQNRSPRIPVSDHIV